MYIDLLDIVHKKFAISSLVSRPPVIICTNMYIDLLDIVHQKFAISSSVSRSPVITSGSEQSCGKSCQVSHSCKRTLESKLLG